MTAPNPARPPLPVTLEGQYCRLEPIAVSHAADMFEAISGPEAEARHRYLGALTPPADVDALKDWISAAISSPSDLYFSVFNLETGKCGGRHALMRQRPEHGSIEIGGVLWGDGIAKTRIATEAFYLTARHIFDDLGNRRFEWKCNNRNEASKRAAERFGFTFEGIFRQDQIIRGENRDTAWFSILDSEWPAIKAGLEDWLAPENFDADGMQKSKLDVRGSA